MAHAMRSRFVPSVMRARASLAPAPVRSAFSKRSYSAAAEHDDEYETEKWKKITLAGIVTCTGIAIYDLSHGHEHFPEPPPYPYLHIRNKEFPWGPDGLFEKKHHAAH